MTKIKYTLTKENQFIMPNNPYSAFQRFIKLISFSIYLLLLTIISCNKEEGCELPNCKVKISNGSELEVTENVSGEDGTHITANIIDESNITNNSASVKFTVLRIGGCHKVIGYGHTWSATNATPRIGIDYFVDYEENINFNDEVATIMRNLLPNTKYWVRSWIVVEIQDCSEKRITYYSDTISTFRTL